jgi:hypothetical protein
VVAVVPGVVVHGAGHYARCERETAKTLMAMEGVGVGSVGGSLTGLALTGASRYFVAPLAFGAIGGASLFVISLVADVYGSAAPAGGTGEPPRRLPRLEIQTGLRYVYDPQFRYRAFLSHGFRLDSRWFWLAPELDVALDAKNRRYALKAGHRLVGPSSERDSKSGTRVDLQLGLTDHDYADDGFAMRTLEGSFALRLDLAELGESLRGSFAETELGYARQQSRFDGLPGDGTDELLARVSVGAYIGAGRGEFRLGYDHRRDTLAGGLRVRGIGAGYLGFVHQRSELYFGRWGVASEVALGSAFLASGFSLIRLGS